MTLKTIALGLAFVLGGVFQLSAQNEEYKHTVALDIGASGVGSVIKVVDLIGNDLLNNNFTTKSSPVFNVTYDYGVKKWFSIGAALSYQRYSGDMGYNFNDEGVDRMGMLDFSYNRINFAVRPLFHYGNSNKLDMYSGFRLGYTNINGEFSTTNDRDYWQTQGEEGTNDLSGIIAKFLTLSEDGEGFLNVSDFIFREGLSFQLVAFGLRWYISEDIGIHTEIAFGAPYYLTFGANYRF